MGFIPEKELIHIFWQSNDGPQTTLNPEGTIQQNGRLKITCATRGASIGYQIIGKDHPNHWNVYNGPLQFPAHTKLRILAWRIGFQPSDTIPRTFK